jgi:hypothetical protein
MRVGVVIVKRLRHQRPGSGRNGYDPRQRRDQRVTRTAADE